MTVELRRSREELHRLIEEARLEGQELLATGLPATQAAAQKLRARYLTWEETTTAILDTSFTASGLMTSSPRDEFAGTAISLLDLKVASTSLPLSRAREVLEDIDEKLRVLGSIDARLDLFDTVGDSRTMRVTPPTDDAAIFLVHGHDVAKREIVRRFLERTTKRDVIILAEQPNGGDDLLSKLLKNADHAGFAVVLLTADDVGGAAKEQETRPRARQNVVFELGLFMALLGRARVATLLQPSVEIPTDFSGVAYISLEGDSWQMELARELKSAGIEVDLNQAM